MKQYTLIILGIVLIFISSCKPENTQEGNLDSLKVDISDTSFQDTINGDLTVENQVRTLLDTQILFFMPAPDERQNIINYYGSYNQYEFQNVFNNFMSLSRTVKNKLTGIDIPVEVTYAKQFVFPLDSDTIVYDLKIEDQIMGYILFDGVNQPLIRNGVQRSRDVTNDIRNYFNLTNFQ